MKVHSAAQNRVPTFFFLSDVLYTSESRVYLTNYNESNIQALINGKMIRADAWNHVHMIKEGYHEVIHLKHLDMISKLIDLAYQEEN